MTRFTRSQERGETALPTEVDLDSLCLAVILKRVLAKLSAEAYADYQFLTECSRTSTHRTA